MATQTLQRRARHLSYFTVGYNLLEGAVSVAVGAAAGSSALIGFGMDCFVESLSGGVMIWRFQHRSDLSAEQRERLEERALKLVGYTFWVLAMYVLYESLRDLLFGGQPEPSLIGIGIAVVSLVVMPLLFYAKYRTGQSLGSRSLVADSKQTLACMLLSAALLVGLGLNYLFGFWQADPLVGVLIGALLVREGWETVREGQLCSC